MHKSVDCTPPTPT